ncbi:LacI family transcriptional regulator [Opitutaceae bacterium TAV4]|nr:LacI family transcriptional regulator [Opitutaceae bacterium TAV4]RRJ98595.1 LacI family transcriptional regulator [Opitutaceae bacterium TAV3]
MKTIASTTLRMPTTREIAAACGCSQPTVSYALNGHPKIPAATRERVLTAARKLGWRPNAFASAYMAHLRTRRTPVFQATLAFLVANRQSGRIGDQGMHMQRHFAGAKARAEELGYGLEPVWLHEPGLTARRLNQVLRSRNIPGLLIPGLVHPSSIFEGIEWAHFVAVTMAWSLKAPMLNRVGVNAAHGFDLMLRKAVDLGYRRIGVVVSDEYDARVNHGVLYPVFYARERWAAEMSGVEIRVCRFARSHMDEIPRIQKWIRENKPDVVLAEATVERAIRQMNWRVPQDVALVSVDRAPEYPDLGGFNQHHELHGSVAVDLLVGQILQNERGLPAIPREVLVKGEWADGISVPPKAEIAALGGRSARL